MIRNTTAPRNRLRASLVASALVLSALVPRAGIASDTDNDCVINPHPPSANISLSEDDSFHYPSQWTGDPDKANSQPGALESMYTSYKWEAYPTGGGDPITVEGTTMFVAVQIPSPFQNGQLAWVRALTIGFLVDDEFVDYAYFAPGEFSPSIDSMDLSIGGLTDTVLEVTSAGLVPVDPSIQVGRLISSGGSETMSMATSDGFEIQVENESFTAPIYPWNDGFSPLWGYYWVRPMLSSEGQMTYDGETYDLYGEAWAEREWDLTIPDLAANYMERHISVQIKGCVTPSGTVPPCMHSNRTILAFDVRDRNTGAHRIHEWREIAPPPLCTNTHLSEVTDWSIIPLEIYTSPLGIEFATKVRLLAPSREVDLILEARVPNQHMSKTQGLLPNWYEGAADVSGTISAKEVTGTAMLESFNIPNGSWHD